MNNPSPSLIFVYNADSGKLYALRDIFIRIFTPDKYSCRLCGLTYGAFGTKSNWRKFIENLNISVEFLHRDEFVDRYKLENFEFPSVYIHKRTGFELLVSRSEKNSSKTLEDLMELVEMKVKGLKLKSH